MSRKSGLKLLSLVVLSGILSAAVKAQDCTPPTITVDSKAYNIFSPDQEMILGDLTYQRLAGDLRFVRDPQLLEYVTAIGEKLIKHLPPTGLKFKFFIVDIPEANAFNVPGGYVFISRKLIGFANSEDELAGVIGHELGHAVVRHGASDFSELLRKVLNVTQVGDRKDISDKYNLLIERRRTKTVARTTEESEEQLQADRVGVFAIVAAGYDGNALASFFNRLAETKGKTGSWFTEIFSKPSPDEKRLSEMIKIADQLSSQCRENHQSGRSQEFLKWQADVVSYRESNRKEDLAGLLWKKGLSPKLRSDISHFAFSPNGQYLLAQDDFAITVIQREPLKVLFQIPAAEKAREATFTPDGQFVVYETENLRFEKWSIAERKPVVMRELVVRRNCWEHKLSPDGKYLACVDFGLNVNVVDTETAQKVWEKKDFYKLSFVELLNWGLSRSTDNGDELDRSGFFHVEFSPESRFLVISRSIKYRNGNEDFALDLRVQDTLLALDLTTLAVVKTGGDLKLMTRLPFAFLDSSRIVAMSSRSAEGGGVFSFPEGKRLASFPISGKQLEATRNPNYAIVKPLVKSRMGIVNVSQGTLAAGLNKADATMWNNLLVYESVTGTVLISKVSYDETKKVLQIDSRETLEMPVGPIANPSAVELSDNFQWIAVSSKSRSAVWDLTSGDRSSSLRGFRGALLADSGKGIADFPKLDPENHILAALSPRSDTADLLMNLPERGARQYRQFVLVRQSLKGEKRESKNKDNPDDDQEGLLRREVRFQLLNIIQNKVVWTREFPREAPRFFFDQLSGRLIFYWSLGSDGGKARLRDDPSLASRVKEVGPDDDDYVVEIVDAFAGKTVGNILLQTGKRSFGINAAYSEGDWLVLHDSNNRVLVFAIKDNELRHRFFGANAAINPAQNQIVVENYPGQLTFYDLTTGDSQAKLDFNSGTAFIRFSLDGKRLFVLSEEQIAYAFDLNKLTTKAPPQ
jgi:hypothetical protein